jgi:hypothetical protein
VILPAATEKMRSAFSSFPFTCSTTSCMWRRVVAFEAGGGESDEQARPQTERRATRARATQKVVCS